MLMDVSCVRKVFLKAKICGDQQGAVLDLDPKLLDSR